MAVTPELALLSQMLHSSDFSPITKGDVTEEHFLTDGGKLVYRFIVGYRHMTSGAARWPSLDIVRDRFETSSLELPDPQPGQDITRLIYEVDDRKARKEVHELSRHLELSSGNTTSDINGAVQGAIEALKRIQNRIINPNQMSLADALTDIVIDYDCGDLTPEGMAWPWPSMTGATKGIHAKEFIVIAGRPKSRKTFTALSIAAHAMIHDGARVLFVSPEMPGKQVLLRLVAFLAKVRYTEFKNAELDKEELSRFLGIADAFIRPSLQSDADYAVHLGSSLPHLPEGAVPSFTVIEGANKPVSWVESQIEVYQPDLVIVDSFYKLSGERGKKSDADWKVVTAVSRDLKNLAMTTGVRLIGTHQMNRESESKVGSVGNMALADAIGQDADLIVRVITGKLNGEDRSALYVLGGREVPFDGVIIHNKPCWDYDEVSTIDNIKQVEELMKREDEANSKELEEEKARNKAAEKAAKKRNPTVTEKTRAATKKVYDPDPVDLNGLENGVA